MAAVGVPAGADFLGFVVGDAAGFEQAPVPTAQRHSALPPGSALLTSVLAFQNYWRHEQDTSAADGITRVALDTGVPCGFGVLTVDTMEQARERVTGGAKRDSGRHAVDAVLASLDVKDELSGRRGKAGFSV